MIIDWTALAERLGSLRPDGESGGTDYAKRALEDILGDENIAIAVELILSYGRGAEVTMNVLTHITSLKALMLAYAAYQRATEPGAAQRAVWMIKHLNNRHALQWIGGFLADQRVARNGIEVLDQLVWSWNVDPATAEPLLLLADSHQDTHVREISAFIRSYLAQRAEEESTSNMPEEP